MASPLQKPFTKAILEMARYRRPYEVFHDFVMMAGITLHNRVLMDDALEQLYLQLIQRYERAEQQRFPELLGMLVMALETPEDFLGDVFMALELGNARTGQYYSPYCVTRLMAEVTIGEGDRETILGGKAFITVSEPASGSGGMLIAFSEVLKERGLSPQRHMWAQATDVDPLAAMMCYLQLSLLGIPAMVITGNSLSQTHSRVMYTPAHILFGWRRKLEVYWKSAPSPAPTADTPASPAAPAPSFVLPSGQMGLFEPA